MSEAKNELKQAIEIMRNPPPVTSKLSALEALDRLALNASGWFTDRVLENLTQARKAILLNYWADALRTLEEARSSMEAFAQVLKARGNGSSGSQEPLERATDELSQCTQVLTWLDRRPPS